MKESAFFHRYTLPTFLKKKSCTKLSLAGTQGPSREIISRCAPTAGQIQYREMRREHNRIGVFIY
jgi:hypothetical protein